MAPSDGRLLEKNLLIYTNPQPAFSTTGRDLEQKISFPERIYAVHGAFKIVEGNGGAALHGLKLPRVCGNNVPTILAFVSVMVGSGRFQLEHIGGIAHTYGICAYHLALIDFV
jgi:hypothetical protein